MKNVLIADVSELLIGSIFVGRWMKTPGNYPKRNILQFKHGESLKTRLIHLFGEETTFFIHLPMKMEPIRSSETSAINTQTAGNYTKRNVLQLKHGKSLKTTCIAMGNYRPTKTWHTCLHTIEF
jgi:hypothetical protein